MIKNKINFLITLVFAFIFALTPFSPAYAQTTGMCSYPAGGSSSGYTQAQCSAVGGTWSGNNSGSSSFAGTSSTSSSSSSSGSSSSVCNPTVKDVGDFICKLGSILKTIIPFLISLGVVYFVWGVVQYVIGDGEEAKKKGKDQIIYGLIGFTVILGMWGLVTIITNTFGIASSAPNINNVTSVITQNNTGAGCNLGSNPKLQNLLSYVTCIIATSIIPLIFALATVMFIWGVVQYVINDGEEAKKERGRQFIVWGLIGLVVMISVWGLVKIVSTTFGINTTFLPQLKSQ